MLRVYDTLPCMRQPLVCLVFFDYAASLTGNANWTFLSSLKNNTASNTDIFQ